MAGVATGDMSPIAATFGPHLRCPSLNTTISNSVAYRHTYKPGILKWMQLATPGETRCGKMTGIGASVASLPT
jgi:hypothetical protein